MTYKIAVLALIAAAVPIASDGGGVPETAAVTTPEQAALVMQPTPPLDADPDFIPTPPPPPLSGFNSQVAFSPTYSSGYYYASPYAGYTSLAYYGSIYTARKFGG